ncbi:predicted protein, partial [Postia placenta Mad-698-R]
MSTEGLAASLSLTSSTSGARQRGGPAAQAQRKQLPGLATPLPDCLREGNHVPRPARLRVAVSLPCLSTPFRSTTLPLPSLPATPSAHEQRGPCLRASKAHLLRTLLRPRHRLRSGPTARPYVPRRAGDNCWERALAKEHSPQLRRATATFRRAKAGAMSSAVELGHGIRDLKAHNVGVTSDPASPIQMSLSQTGASRTYTGGPRDAGQRRPAPEQTNEYISSSWLPRRENDRPAARASTGDLLTTGCVSRVGLHLHGLDESRAAWLREVRSWRRALWAPRHDELSIFSGRTLTVATKANKPARACSISWRLHGPRVSASALPISPNSAGSPPEILNPGSGSSLGHNSKSPSTVAAEAYPSLESYGSTVHPVLADEACHLGQSHRQSQPEPAPVPAPAPAPVAQTAGRTLVSSCHDNAAAPAVSHALPEMRVESAATYCACARCARAVFCMTHAPWRQKTRPGSARCPIKCNRGHTIAVCNACQDLGTRAEDRTHQMARSEHTSRAVGIQPHSGIAPLDARYLRSRNAAG